MWSQPWMPRGNALQHGITRCRHRSIRPQDPARPIQIERRIGIAVDQDIFPGGVAAHQPVHHLLVFPSNPDQATVDPILICPSPCSPIDRCTGICE